MTDTYVVRARKQAWDKFSQYIYDVYADSTEGFANFCMDHANDISPASTVGIADLGVTLRLRMDGNWDTIAGELPEGTDPVQEITEKLLDDLISDEELESDITGEEASV